MIDPMLKENGAILKTTSLVVKKEKGTIASGYTAGCVGTERDCREIVIGKRREYLSYRH